MWINQGDIILVGLRDYQDAKADVILRYNPDEARNLKTYGELPETGTCNCLHKDIIVTIVQVQGSDLLALNNGQPSHLGGFVTV